MRVAISNPVITKSFVACQLEDNSFVAGEEPPEMWLAVAVSPHTVLLLFATHAMCCPHSFGVCHVSLTPMWLGLGHMTYCIRDIQRCHLYKHIAETAFLRDAFCFLAEVSPSQPRTEG